MPYKDPNSEAAKASNKRKTDKYRGTEKSNARYKRYHAKHPELRRENWYKGEYGITLEAFEAQIVAQNNLCPIGNHPFGPRGKGKTSPCQDHDHETDENRLILCREHNVGLGQFHDSIPELESAILYLQSFLKRTGELPCRTHLPSDAKLLEYSN
jgi:hypothetical protein